MRTQKIEGSDRPRPLRVVTDSSPADAVGLEPEGRALKDSSDNGPVIVGVDGSARSMRRARPCRRVAATLRTRLVIATSIPSASSRATSRRDEHELIVRGIAESTFDQSVNICLRCPSDDCNSWPRRRPRPASTLLAEREHAALWWSARRIGQPSAVSSPAHGRAPAVRRVGPSGRFAGRLSEAKRRVQLVGCGFDGSPGVHQALAGQPSSPRRPRRGCAS